VCAFVTTFTPAVGYVARAFNAFFYLFNVCEPITFEYALKV